jgi:hypothetical protein
MLLGVAGAKKDKKVEKAIGIRKMLFAIEGFSN